MYRADDDPVPEVFCHGRPGSLPNIDWMLVARGRLIRASGLDGRYLSEEVESLEVCNCRAGDPY